MRKIFLATFVLLIFSSTAFAADVLFSVDDSDPIRTVEWYAQTDLLEEHFDNKTFEVPVKLVIIMKQDGDRAEHEHFILKEFRFIDNVWYVRQENSSRDFNLLNENEFDQKLFDACVPNCKLAQTYPR